MFVVVALPSNEFMIENAYHNKCLAIETSYVTVKSCDIYSLQQAWQWTPFSQLQNTLTLACLSAPKGAKASDRVNMAGCDRYNASQIWDWREKLIELNGTNMRLNYGRVGTSVAIFEFIGVWAQWKVFSAGNSVENEIGIVRAFVNIRGLIDVFEPRLVPSCDKFGTSCYHLQTYTAIKFCAQAIFLKTVLGAHLLSRIILC